jgi:hypothetical protein
LLYPLLIYAKISEKTDAPEYSISFATRARKRKNKEAPKSAAPPPE